MYEGKDTHEKKHHYPHSHVCCKWMQIMKFFGHFRERPYIADCYYYCDASFFLAGFAVCHRWPLAPFLSLSSTRSDTVPTHKPCAYVLPKFLLNFCFQLAPRKVPHPWGSSERLLGTGRKIWAFSSLSKAKHEPRTPNFPNGTQYRIFKLQQNER